jgi:hypothetical protein
MHIDKNKVNSEPALLIDKHRHKSRDENFIAK